MSTYLHGETKLHYLVVENDYNAVKELILAGESVNSFNKFGHTPLMDCLTLNNRLMITLLLESGSNINAIDKEGNTPLHHAYINQCPKKIIGILIQYGADSNIKNIYDEFPEEAT